MSENVSAELMLEHLKYIRNKVDGVDIRLKDLRDEVISLRGDSVRRDRALASLEDDISTIKARLDISDIS